MHEPATKKTTFAILGIPPNVFPTSPEYTIGWHSHRSRKCDGNSKNIPKTKHLTMRTRCQRTKGLKFPHLVRLSNSDVSRRLGVVKFSELRTRGVMTIWIFYATRRKNYKLGRNIQMIHSLPQFPFLVTGCHLPKTLH